MNFRSRHLLCSLTLSLVAWGFASCTAAAGDKAEGRKTEPSPDASGISGKEIFLREWIANDPRSHGGDGLGPVFNDTSCVSCHNQGGVGGGGAEAKNVMVITAFLANAARMVPEPPRKTAPVPKQPEDAAPELERRKR